MANSEVLIGVSYGYTATGATLPVRAVGKYGYGAQLLGEKLHAAVAGLHGVHVSIICKDRNNFVFTGVHKRKFNKGEMKQILHKLARIFNEDLGVYVLEL